MAVEILCPDLNGAIISMTVSAQNRITNATVDCTNATEQVRIWYPEDGSKIQRTVLPGQVASQNFVGGNQLDRLTQQLINPTTGLPETVWLSPTWKAWSP